MLILLLPSLVLAQLPPSPSGPPGIAPAGSFGQPTFQGGTGFQPSAAAPGTVLQPPSSGDTSPAYYYYDNFPSNTNFAPAAPGTGSPGGSNANVQYPDYGNFYPDFDPSKTVQEAVDPNLQSSSGGSPSTSSDNANATSAEEQLPETPSQFPTFAPLPDEFQTFEPVTEPANLCKWDDQPYEEGARLDHGSYWFECMNGKFKPMGCFSDLGQRLLFGQTYNVSNGYEMLCDRIDNGTMKIRPMACLHNAKKYFPGESFQDDFYWYTCAMRDDQISKEMLGCVDSKNNRVAAGGVFKQGSNLFQCFRDPLTGGMVLEPVACIHRGQRYDVGQTMIDGLFWYTCKKRGLSFLAPELSGCFYANRTLKAGDKYYRSGFVYQCQRKTDSSLGHVIVGCLETNAQTGDVIGEKKFGETWPIGTPPYMFMAFCEKTPGNAATQRLVHCIYSVHGKNDTVIQPGCYKQVNPDLMVMCYNRGDGALGIDRAGPGEQHKVVSLNLANCA